MHNIGIFYAYFWAPGHSMDVEMGYPLESRGIPVGFP